MNGKNDGKVWLLPHPGAERLPKGPSGELGWPAGDAAHGRKFMRVKGGGVTKAGELKSGEVGVWAEYEAPTHAERIEALGREPRAVHTPCTSVEYPKDRLNTDPWIFQQGFVWSCCRHKPAWQCGTRPAPCCGAEPVSRCPQPGDIVLFGSRATIRGVNHWVLDTVVVIERRLDAVRDEALEGPFQSLVAPTLSWGGVKPYVGRPRDSRRPFSFAPCKLGGRTRDLCFERPAITTLLQELRLVQNDEEPEVQAQALARCYATDGVAAFWHSLTNLIWSEGLLLGVRFQLPAIKVLGRPSTPPPRDAAPNCASPGRKRGAA